jgi:hypothetical protein
MGNMGKLEVDLSGIASPADERRGEWRHLPGRAESRVR